MYFYGVSTRMRVNFLTVFRFLLGFQAIPLAIAGAIVPRNQNLTCKRGQADIEYRMDQGSI